MRDIRDPTLLAVEIASGRRPGETLSQAADRLMGADVPDFDTPAARERRARLNGTVERTNAMLAPRSVTR